MNLVRITDLNDPAVSHYRNMTDRNLAAEGDLFIAEGEYLVQRLLDSPLPALSVLITERRLNNPKKPLNAPNGVPVYVVPEALMTQITGIEFHGGILAIGRRPPAAPLESLFVGPPAQQTFVICPDINNTANLGAILRVAAGFGVDAVILGESCADPWYRRSVRVSMGAALTLPIIRSTNLATDLRTLHQRWGVELTAAVLSDRALPLHAVDRPARLGLVMGNEEYGVPPRLLRTCQREVTIPMHHTTDSLNVVVAAGVMLYHFTQVAPMRGVTRSRSM